MSRYVDEKRKNWISSVDSFTFEQFIDHSHEYKVEY